MFIEMSCSCGASLQAEAGDYDTLVLLWANSFINSHQECGYMIVPKETSQREKEL